MLESSYLEIVYEQSNRNPTLPKKASERGLRMASSHTAEDQNLANDQHSTHQIEDILVSDLVLTLEYAADWNFLIPPLGRMSSTV